MKYFAKIRYVGTDFHGFQVQPCKRTVQGELSSAFFNYFGSETLITGCSRTDAGVHANEFCITVENDSATVPPEKLPLAISQFLPTDISLFYAKECDSDFHVRYDVKSKEYVYLIRNTKIQNPFFYKRCYLVPRKIDDEAIEKMNVAAKFIVGKQDFTSFMAEGSSVVDTVRSVYALTVLRDGDFIKISITADGFLYNMVRIIVGTLLEVAFGRISEFDIPKIIKSKNRAFAGPTAPSEGLYLNKVEY